MLKEINSKCVRKRDNFANFYALFLILFYFISMAMPWRVIYSVSSLRVVNWFPMDDGEPRKGTRVWEQCQMFSLHFHPLWPSAVEMPLVINSITPHCKINSSNLFPSNVIETMLSLENPYQMCFMCSRVWEVA